MLEAEEGEEAWTAKKDSVHVYMRSGRREWSEENILEFNVSDVTKSIIHLSVLHCFSDT